jgi:hypothetical protein
MDSDMHFLGRREIRKDIWGCGKSLFHSNGQWQSGFFQAVAGVGFSNFAQVKLKTGWA